MDRCECCVFRFNWGGNGLYHCSPSARFINTPKGSYARAAPHNYSYIHNPGSLHYVFPTACVMLFAKILNTSDCKAFQTAVNSQTLFSGKKNVFLYKQNLLESFFMSLAPILHLINVQVSPDPPHCSQWVQRNLRHFKRRISYSKCLSYLKKECSLRVEH